MLKLAEKPCLIFFYRIEGLRMWSLQTLGLSEAGHVVVIDWFLQTLGLQTLGLSEAYLRTSYGLGEAKRL